MKALFNHEIVDGNISLSIGDRALQYGDGLFETIAVENVLPKYLDYHIERLNKGAKVLNLELPDLDWESAITSLVMTNNLEEASIKLMVWRKPTTAKGFGFNNTDCHFLLLCRKGSKKISVAEKASFSKSIYFSYSALSGIKTLNALPYIIAANERQQRALDELIVLNDQGYVCECVSSNIFWVKGDVYFTPSLESGCLEGVTRRVLIEKLNKEGMSLNEVLVTPQELLQANVIFTTNSSGIRFIAQVDHHTFDTSLKSDKVFFI